MQLLAFKNARSLIEWDAAREQPMHRNLQARFP
jgi:hypothetical protein